MHMEGQENMQSQPGLNLDTEILQKNENISTSLCDRFGIHMYTLEFMEHEKRYQEKQQEKEDEIFSNVLNNPEKEMTDTAFKRVIQAETTAVIKAEYNENKAIIEIDTARCIKGALPSRQLKLILAWCVLHQDELMQNWELSKDGKPLNRINPLV